MTSIMGNKTGALEFNLGRMTERVLDARKDHVLCDFSRVIGPQYARMVQKFAALQGEEVPAHNNKALFLEVMDLWARKRLGAEQEPMPGARKIEDPREAVIYAMEPWYEALDLDDPSKYKLKRREPPPIYVGDETDAVTLLMGIAACLDITPMRFVFGGREANVMGKKEEVFQRVWAKVKADGTWYDSDIMTPGALGQRPEFEHYEEVEVGL